MNKVFHDMDEMLYPQTESNTAYESSFFPETPARYASEYFIDIGICVVMVDDTIELYRYVMVNEE